MFSGKLRLRYDRLISSMVFKGGVKALTAEGEPVEINSVLTP
jgi:hypothetical protein